MGGGLTRFGSFANDVFIETGTFKGRTVRAAVHSKLFKVVMSIELDPMLYRAAKQTFIKNPRVRLYHGSSAEILPQIIDPDVSTTFYLDAHKTIILHNVVGSFLNSAECPLLAELNAILSRQWTANLIVIIDDARLFSHEWWLNGMYSEHFDRSLWPMTEEVVGLLTGAGLGVEIVDDRIIGRVE